MSFYLITGGAGFIGSNLVKELLAQGQFVRVLDNFSTGKRENLAPYQEHPNFEMIEGDLRSLNVVRDSVKGVEYILHQGALPSVPRSIIDPITTNEVNITGTLNMLEAAREFSVKRVVFASSSSVYGNSEILPKNESLTLAPLSPYAITKYTGELYCQVFYKLYGLETVVLRYFNVFGPNQDPTSQYSAVIPKFIKIIKEGRSPVIYGDGSQSRDFTYVSNNVEANLLACITPGIAGEVFNIACGKSYSLLDLVSAINKLMNKDVKPQFENIRLGDVKHSLASINKAKENLKFTVNTSFMEGLKSLINLNFQN
jgi:nucleoside-diphosphate-sugar epimerase